MSHLRTLEDALGRPLTTDEIMDNIQKIMREYGIDHHPFIPYGAPR